MGTWGCQRWVFNREGAKAQRNVVYIYHHRPLPMDKILRNEDKDLQPITMDQWLKTKPPELRPLAKRWFDQIKACSDEVVPIFHDNYPIACVDRAPFAYVNVYSEHVNVGFFYGAYLPDPHGLLEGTGKHGRHVKLWPGKAADEKAISILIEAAYDDIRRRLA